VEGHPIASAKVYATRRAQMPNGHSALLAAVETEAAGHFQMQVLTTHPHLLSLEVSKRGYFSRIYENVDIRKLPPIISLEKGVTVKGNVTLPPDISLDSHYTVKVFPADTQMGPSLNPLVLHKPLLSRHFPMTEPTFVVEGLFAEKYTLWIVGKGISASSIDVDTSANADAALIIAANRPVTLLQGQVLWADTSDPVRNAVISRSWYPWELTPYDTSMTLDRFEVETDVHGTFKFANLTEGHYQLHIRAVHAILEKTTGRYQRTFVYKRVEVPACDTRYRIYVGRRDGTPFIK